MWLKILLINPVGSFLPKLCIPARSDLQTVKFGPRSEFLQATIAIFARSFCQRVICAEMCQLGRTGRTRLLNEDARMIGSRPRQTFLFDFPTNIFQKIRRRNFTFLALPAFFPSAQDDNNSGFL